MRRAVARPLRPPRPRPLQDLDHDPTAERQHDQEHCEGEQKEEADLRHLLKVEGARLLRALKPAREPEDRLRRRPRRQRWRRGWGRHAAATAEAAVAASSAAARVVAGAEAASVAVARPVEGRRAAADPVTAVGASGLEAMVAALGERRQHRKWQRRRWRRRRCEKEEAEGGDKAGPPAAAKETSWRRIRPRNGGGCGGAAGGGGGGVAGGGGWMIRQPAPSASMQSRGVSAACTRRPPTHPSSCQDASWRSVAVPPSTTGS